MLRKKSIIIMLYLISILSLQAFSNNNYHSEGSFLTYSQNRLSRDYWPTEGWKTTTPEAQNMNAGKINEMYENINRRYEIHSILIIRHGYIVFEKYPHINFNVNKKHRIWSITKSFTSALIGIMIQEGFIENIEEYIIDFFPEYTFENLDSKKEQLKLKHLLSMTTGIRWDEWTYPYSDPRNSLNQLRQGDPVLNFLNLPMDFTPGEEWVYCSGSPLLMSYLLYKTTGLKPLNFANHYLFQPMGINNVLWSTDDNGIHDGQGGLSFTPRELAKFGYLYLNNGTWDE
ncbi:MAG: serine hydrolase domain-containing protein, partial [Candidatus Hodarchaeales archaeon]